MLLICSSQAIVRVASPRLKVALEEEREVTASRNLSLESQLAGSQEEVVGADERVRPVSASYLNKLVSDRNVLTSRQDPTRGFVPKSITGHQLDRRKMRVFTRKDIYTLFSSVGFTCCFEQ